MSKISNNDNLNQLVYINIILLDYLVYAKNLFILKNNTTYIIFVFVLTNWSFNNNYKVF